MDRICETCEKSFSVKAMTWQEPDGACPPNWREQYRSLWMAAKLQQFKEAYGSHA